jgi:two-component sensor histidine kinase
MASEDVDSTIERLRRQQAALATFGTFAFKETNLLAIINEAARICAASLDVPFCKVCRYRPEENDLLIEAGCGWSVGVVGRVVSQANETSPQGRAYATGEPVIIRDVRDANNLALPDFYPQHGIVSTVDVIISATDGTPYGVLEIDSPTLHQYDQYDINFLTGFANVLAEAVARASKNETMRLLLLKQKLMAEELQHRVRNNLQVVSGMLSDYARNAPNDTARQGVSSISGRVITLAQIYDTLLGVGLSDTVDLSDYLQRLCLSLPGLQDERGRTIVLDFQGEPVQLPLDNVTALGMIIAELVTNSYRHAFPLVASGLITVTLTRSADHTRALLEIQDDGVGYSEPVEPSRRGIGLVKRLVEQIGGTLQSEATVGMLWTLSFPLAVARATPSLAS